MEPYYRSPSGDVTLWQGDALAVLRALPAGSVHTCITSPPYWNLRDYQTATWEGGDAGCEHQARDKSRGMTSDARLGYVRESETYRAVCGKCGARRVDAQLGLEESPDDYVAALVAVFREVKRVLRDDGTLWLNLSDSYANDAKWGGFTGGKHANGLHGDTGIGRAKRETGYPAKCLYGMPWRVAFALIDDGWTLRSDIIWSKPNPMPESVGDRPTRAHEYVFLLSKGPRYFYDATAIREDAVPDALAKHPYGRRKLSDWKEAAAGSGIKSNDDFHNKTADVLPYRNKRSVWTISSEAFPQSHFATFPTKLVEPCLLSGTSARGCCPACGAPWVRVVEREKAPRGDAFGRKQVGEYDHGQAGSGYLMTLRSETTGWRAGCACEDAGDLVPAVVLDPFAGASTTGIVARKLGRSFVGIELSEDYCRMSRERLSQMALPIGGLG